MNVSSLSVNCQELEGELCTETLAFLIKQGRSTVILQTSAFFGMYSVALRVGNVIHITLVYKLNEEL